jgi:hypothetical protein
MIYHFSYNISVPNVPILVKKSVGDPEVLDFEMI